MWGSSEESDDPKPALFRWSSGTKAKTTTDALKLKVTISDKRAPSRSSKPTSKKTLPSTFCTVGSDDSLDSDSSSGSDVKKAPVPSGARAALSSQVPKPKPRSTLLGSGLGGVAGQRPVLANEVLQSLPSRRELDVRPKTGGTSTKLSGGNVVGPSTGSRAKASSDSASSSRHSGLKPNSSKEELSFTPYLAESQSSVPKARQAVQEKLRSFEKYHVKPADTDRGQQYSKRDEKPNLSEFLPEGLQSTSRRIKGVSPRSATSNGGARADGASGSSDLLGRVDENRLRLSALKLDDEGKRGSRVAAASGSPRPAPSPQANPTGPRGATAGAGPGSEKNPRANRRRDHSEESSPTDDSGDESLEALLPATQRYVPPPRRAGRDRLPSGASDDYPPPGGRRNSASGPERERRPNIEERFWARGQRPGEERNNGGGAGRHFAGRGEDERNFGRNWRQRDNNNEDGYRNNWRGNQDDRNRRPRDNNDAQGFDDRVRGEGRRDNGDYGRRHVPPPGPGNEGGEEARRGAGRQQQGPDRGGNNNRQYNRPRPDGFRPLESNLSFTRLRELKSKDPAEVVAALSYSKEGLSRLLKNENKLRTEDQMLRLLLAALARASQCHSMPAQQNEILNLVRTSSFHEILGTFLTRSSMTAQATELTSIIGESADLLRTLLTLFPSHIHKVMMAYCFLETAQKHARLKGAGELPPDVAKKVEDFEIAKDAAMEALQRKETRKRGETVDEDSLTPPDDFRQMSVFPTMEDLDKEDLPFLRKNKALGGYTSVDHYLDVQFRLLREDFVYPLREGIAAYLSMVGAPRRGRQLKVGFFVSRLSIGD